MDQYFLQRLWSTESIKSFVIKKNPYLWLKICTLIQRRTKAYPLENMFKFHGKVKRWKGTIPQKKIDHRLSFVYQPPVKAYGKCFQNAEIWHIVIAKRGAQWCCYRKWEINSGLGAASFNADLSKFNLIFCNHCVITYNSPGFLRALPKNIH